MVTSTDLAGRVAGIPDTELVERALAYVREHGAGVALPTGETVQSHSEGMLRILDGLRVDDSARAAACLFGLAAFVPETDAEIEPRFGEEVARLVNGVRQLLRIGAIAGNRPEVESAAPSKNEAQARHEQVEALRKMLLAFAQDIRVVLVRLASRLQTLRWLAETKQAPLPGVARETLDIYAPLANRLGIWQMKWELEDLAFRFEQPDTYKRIARLLDEKRIEREGYIAGAIARLQSELTAAGIRAEVSGRPKHIYSIWKKMRGKELDFADLYDVRAFRVIVDDIKDCYTVLGIVHHIWQPIPREFDDYISRPKANGYKSLHTVVIGDDGRAFEVQIRTHEMHHFAEYGVAAHWRYKEAGSRGYAGQFSASERYDEKIAWLRQLLAWKDDADHSVAHDESWEQIKHAAIDDHIYVLTPQARVVALPQGATAVDFAYYLHSDLGHRCRGARVDGTMVPLNTPLKNGQTVEIIVVKQGGPSRDWLNADLGYLASSRARAKVRAWFNAMDSQETIAQGRALIDKTLQREGKTAVKLEDLATRLGFKTPDELFAAVAKDEFSLRHVEHALRHPEGEVQAPLSEEDAVTKKSRATSVARGAKSGVLVVGVDSLMTQMSRCCKPAPPDEIVGFVTRGRGVSIHRRNCHTFQQLSARAPERVIQTEWGKKSHAAVYPVDIQVEAIDRQGLLRDISEVLSREKINVTGVKTLSSKGVARMQFTAEVSEATQLQRALLMIEEVQGVLQAKRK
ncbi:GTP pyrophosphokinase [Cupriavidus alkaliphilus]|uniref:RelA/SpoT family protein n=1 Tax=Cupriavidus alkaliphilus TaxID=942866 RepID=UPI000DE6363E|nr:bifunctional (p)ppGpp synthetase/guanosine-3',5'-bis(diphosphate) 3'-pyrophosphohydrolase [Cupriavidus alkaliphilus]PVY78718.1 GTP pyrophosphokinase [Cupriavidus alkaliphilus]